jgi:uncharacterized protein
MQLSSKRAGALLALLCLSCVGYSCSYNAASSDNAASGARGVLSAESSPSPQGEKGQVEVKSPLPQPTGFVNDYAGVFDGESKGRLESVLRELRDKSEIEFAVVTVETTGGRPIFDYSLDVAKGWGIGPKDTSKGGGVLLLLATKQHKWRIQVSRSLEKDLPDDECKRLGEQSSELYKKGKYAEGLTKYVGAITGRLEEARGFKLSKRLSVE